MSSFSSLPLFLLEKKSAICFDVPIIIPCVNIARGISVDTRCVYLFRALFVRAGIVHIFLGAYPGDLYLEFRYISRYLHLFFPRRASKRVRFVRVFFQRFLVYIIISQTNARRVCRVERIFALPFPVSPT